MQSSMAKLRIFAHGEFGQYVASQWQECEPQREIEVVDFPALEMGIPAVIQSSDPSVECFVAAGSEFLNLRRSRLIELLQNRGLRMTSWIAKTAILQSNVSIGKNCWIGDHVVVGSGTVVSDGVVINPIVNIGTNCKLGACAWFEPGAILQNRSEVGRATIIGPRVVVSEGLTIGELCEIATPNYVVYKEVGSRTYIHPLFDSPVEITSGNTTAMDV